MKSKRKRLMMSVGLATLIGVYVVHIITFALAYASPNKSVAILINKFGEADIELIWFVATFPLVLWVLTKFIKMVRKSE